MARHASYDEGKERRIHRLTAEIKKEALSLGFDAVGIAKAEPLEEEKRRLSEWLDRGYHATMRWMADKFEKRVDPGKVLPGAKSIVAVAMNYYRPDRHADQDGVGKISRYAWGDDYHDILQSRLDRLLEFVRSKVPESRGKAYVDTGPVMDKVWAQRAGIGWEGKHTNVISTEIGSWIFLGELILDIDLECDEPAVDRCGSCTLCIEACPTGAIVEPYVVDSGKCISYLTIEHRGEISPELGEKFQQWIYGCDICQDVCPWNQKFAEPSTIAGFEPREHNLAPRIEEVISMTQEEFTRNFRKSPIKRTKLSGLKRNARVAAGPHTSSEQKPTWTTITESSSSDRAPRA